MGIYAEIMITHPNFAKNLLGSWTVSGCNLVQAAESITEFPITGATDVECLACVVVLVFPESLSKLYN